MPKQALPGLGLLGLLAIAFGAIPIIWTGSVPVFSVVNFLVGVPMLLFAAVRAGMQLRSAAAAPMYRRTLLGGVGLVVVTIAAAVLAERAAERSGAQFDWSLERRYEVAPAVLAGLADIGGETPIQALLYRDTFDPRIRSTRILLSTLADTGHLEFSERRIDEHPDEEDCFALSSSNSIVLTIGDGPLCERRFERIERPTEGSFFEALFRLRQFDERTVIVARGAGEGDLQASDKTGYSGFGQALITEGYAVREMVLAASAEVPEDADLVVLLAPRRALLPESLAAIDRYLSGGGRLVAFLEPGVQTGVEELLARWGLSSPEAWVVDPASASLEGDRPGLAPLAFRYSSRHPVTELLSPNQMTLFRGTRAFELRKPEPEDHIEAVVWASRRSWLVEDPSVLDERSPLEPIDLDAVGYHVLVATGRYPRGENETRIVAFGDGHLVSNRYLRALYNLDLVMNAIHWTVERESDVTIRPKHAVSSGLQFPIPLESTLTLFQGLGLLVPELLLAGGLLAWARSRT